MRRAIVSTGLGALLACAAACKSAPPAGSVVQPSDPPAAAGSTAPQLASDGTRTVLSWLEPDPAGGATLRYALRRDGGWDAARTAVHDAQLAVDVFDVPGVAPIPGGSLAAHWSRKRDGSSYAREIAVAVSSDGGASWSAPAKPHSDNTDTEHGMATLLPLADGRFGFTWLDGRAGESSQYGEGGTGLYWAGWNGAGFDPEVLLDPRVCDCCKTTAALTPSGPLVAYRDRDPDERRDTSIVREIGSTWQPPASLPADGWKIKACPTNGPAAAARGDRAVVTWFTGAKGKPAVWAVQSADGGTTFGAPVQIDSGAPSGRVDAAVLPDGSSVVVWLEKVDTKGEVRARRIDTAGIASAPVKVAETSPGKTSGFPRVATAGDRQVLVAWTEIEPPQRVRSAVVTLP
jgi:hypothetical protein